jgi:putative PIN family toxin of toxin-antitoxin system
MIFLDSSVWIAAILSERGGSAEVIRQIINKKFQIVSSLDVFEEVTRNLNQKYPHKVQSFLVLFNSLHPILVQPDKRTILQARKLINMFDAPILAATMRSKCEFLITLDRKHFMLPEISTATGIKILSPGDYLNNYLK